MLLRLSTAFLNSGKIDHAIAILQKHLIVEPNDFRGHFNMATCLLKKKKYLEAIPFLLRAMELGAPKEISYENISGAFIAAKNPQKALYYACKALSENFPQNEDVPNGYAGCICNINVALRQLGRLQDALLLTWFLCTQAAIPLHPTQLSSHPASHWGDTVFVCVKWGTKYNSAYVNNMYRSVMWSAPKFNCSFVCLTDDNQGIDSNVFCVCYDQLHEEAAHKASHCRGWWTKALLFSRAFKDRLCMQLKSSSPLMIYVDLDTVFCQRDWSQRLVEHIQTTCTEQCAENYLFVANSEEFLSESRGMGINSSVMMWRLGTLHGIFDYLMRPISQLSSNASNPTTIYQQLQQFVYKFDYYLEMLFLVNTSSTRTRSRNEPLDLCSLFPAYEQWLINHIAAFPEHPTIVQFVSRYLLADYRSWQENPPDITTLPAMITFPVVASKPMAIFAEADDVHINFLRPYWRG